ncbi:MAG: hypothetical protein JXR91_04600 [Deltaproteobacteria bacterium]|nr:hypothetical protein [Deltaproteobacteria bacterium]
MQLLSTDLKRRIIWMLLSLLLMVPAVFSDFLNDDYFYNSELYQVSSPFTYYDFLSDRENFPVPWWTDDNFKVLFFRPLSSLSLHLDYTLSPHNALPGHLQSVAWLLILLLGAFSIFDRLLDKLSMRWALPIFSLGLFTTWAAGWISARHALMGGAFSIWSIALFLNGIEKKRPIFTIYSLGLFALGLLSSEAALAVVPAALLLPLIYKNNSDNTIRESLAKGLAHVLIGGIYLAFYKLGGYGACGSDLYLDPLSSPAEYLTALPSKMLALFASFTLGLPAMMRIMPELEPVVVIGGLFSVALLAGLFWLRRNQLSSNEQRRIKVLWIAVPLSMLPEMSGMVEGRGALLGGVLFCVLAATLLNGAFYRAGQQKRVIKLLAVILFAGLLVFSPLSRIAASLFIYMGASNLTRVGENALIGCSAKQDVYQINADSLMAVMYPFATSRYQGRVFNNWYQMGQAPRDLKLTRTSKDTLRLEAPNGVLESYLWLFREKNSILKTKTKLINGSLRVTIVKEKNNIPTIVDFRIKELLDESICLVKTDGFLLKKQEIPQVGTSVIIPWIPPMQQ